MSSTVLALDMNRQRSIGLGTELISQLVAFLAISSLQRSAVAEHCRMVFANCARQQYSAPLLAAEEIRGQERRWRVVTSTARLPRSAHYMHPADKGTLEQDLACESQQRCSCSLLLTPVRSWCLSR
jgi:hypothetical protein